MERRGGPTGVGRGHEKIKMGGYDLNIVIHMHDAVIMKPTVLCNT